MTKLQAIFSQKKTPAVRYEGATAGQTFCHSIKILEINGNPAEGGKILNLSTNGARLELPFSFRIKDQLKLLVLLPGLKKPSTFIGQVKWKKPANSEGHYVTGLQFYQNYWDLDQWLRQLTFKEA